MKLAIGDRIALLNQVLPERASMLEMVMRAEVAEKIKITQTDIEKHGIKQSDDGKLTWETGCPEPDPDYQFSDVELEFLRKQVDRVDDAKQITALSLGVCRKIRER